MHFSKHLFAAAVLAGAVPFTAVAPAAAAPVHDPMHLRNAVPSMTETVQYRRWHGGYHRHHYHRGRGWGWGAPAAAGLAAGAIIGGAIASQNAARADASIDYCMQRFRSYDPESGTYLGYDGMRHPCP